MRQDSRTKGLRPNEGVTHQMGPGATALTRMPLLGVIICARPLVNCRMAPCSVSAQQPQQGTWCRHKNDTAVHMFKYCTCPLNGASQGLDSRLCQHSAAARSPWWLRSRGSLGTP